MIAGRQGDGGSENSRVAEGNTVGVFVCVFLRLILFSKSCLSIIDYPKDPNSEESFQWKETNSLECCRIFFCFNLF